MTIVAATPALGTPGSLPVTPAQASLRVGPVSRLATAVDHLLHPHRGDWSPDVSPDPRGCWACVDGLPVGPLCASCQLRVSARAAVEGAFPVLDSASSAKTLRGHRWN